MSWAIKKETLVGSHHSFCSLRPIGESYTLPFQLAIPVLAEYFDIAVFLPVLAKFIKMFFPNAGSLALRLYGKGDYGVLPKEEVIQRIQKCAEQHTDFS